MFTKLSPLRYCTLVLVVLVVTVYIVMVYFVWVKVVRVHVFILMSFKVVSFRAFVFRENVVLLSLLSLTNFIKVKDAKLFIINFSIHCVKKPL